MIKLDGRVVNLGHFPDGTLLIKENVSRDYEAERSATINWKYENDGELVALIYLTRHLKEHGVKTVHLNMPYIPNARQDRVKSDEDVFTLKYFAEVINSLNFASVTVLDPHSVVSEALIDRVIIKTPAKNIEKVLEKIGEENILMFYPDEGAMKRYSSMADKPYVFGMKKRDWSTGQPYPIFKNPKDGGFKKSQKGCCVVKLDENGNYTYKDEYTWAEAINDTENQLVTVFKDGKMVKEQSLAEIRNILHGGKF